METTVAAVRLAAKPLLDHIGRHKWVYIFAAYIWWWVWYAALNFIASFFGVNTVLPGNSDIMPVINGLPIIIIGWRAVALDRQLGEAVESLDEGAAFAFPAGQPGLKQKFIADLRRMIQTRSRNVAIVLVPILAVAAIVGAVNLGNGPQAFITWLLVLGVPLIGLPVGILLGKMLGYAQLLEVMDSKGVRLTGLSTPQARTALRGLEDVYAMAILIAMSICLICGGWWIAWYFGLTVYWNWRGVVLICWGIGMLAFVATGALPAWRFRRRVAELSGGPEGRKAIDAQVRQAEADLNAMLALPADAQYRRRQRISDLRRFIANLKEQKIESWVLDARLHAVLLAVNVVLIVWIPLDYYRSLLSAIVEKIHA